MPGFDLLGFRKRQRRAELEQIDRELRRVVESFERAAVFLADQPDGGEARTEALAELAATTVEAALKRFLLVLPFKDIVVEVLTAIQATMQDALAIAGGLVAESDGLKESALAYLANMQAAMSAFSLGRDLAGGIGGGGGGGTLTLPSPPPIPALANGGIVTKPTLALVGEGREPEAIIPLSQLGRYGGGGGGGGGGAIYVTIEYHDHTMQGTDRARLAEFARNLKPELERVVTTSW